MIASATLINNARSRVNRLFFAFGITVALWLTALMIGDLKLSHFTSLEAVRAATFIGTPMAPLIVYFSAYFPVNIRKPSLKLQLGVLIPAAIFMALSFSSLLIPDITFKGRSAQPINLGLAYSLQSIYVLLAYAVGFIIFFRKINKVKAKERSQIKFVLLGLVLALGVNVVTGIVLTTLNVGSDYSNFAGSLSFLAFIAFTAYAIVRHRLFDLRLAITRVIGYSITIILVASIYSLLLIAVSMKLSLLGTLTTGQVVVLVLPTIFIALTFHRIAAVVARLTEAVFYRDAYDVREVLDNLSDALLAESDIDEIMNRSIIVLTAAIKPVSAYFAVLNSSGIVYKHVQLGKQDVGDIAPFLLRLGKETESLIEREEAPDRPIAKLMAQQNVELLQRLGPKDAPIGVLLLGAKRNGSMYTKQDISLLRISAKNLGIALDNAKKYEQIIHFADTLHKEVKRATTRLRKANEELKTLDALKDDFISTASHQLRSPAVSVHDALHMLNYPNVTKKDRDELLLLAESSSERLVTVVRTMLNMARIQAGHFTIDTSEADLVELINKELTQVKVLADQKSIKLRFAKPPTAATVNIDVAKINEAVANYVENAIKYSPNNTTITLSLTHEKGMYRFEVADQGMGVPPGERDQLFGRFYRASNARQEQPDGNGIGLYVVKMIAEGHGGEAYYRPGVEQGSVFGLTIAIA